VKISDTVLGLQIRT